jgi:hypothetical protein
MKKEQEVAMKQQHHTPSRLNFEFPLDARKNLKIQAVRLGLSIRELATQAILEKLDALELQADIEAAEQALELHEAKGCKTISHEEMMKKVGWDEL